MSSNKGEKELIDKILKNSKVIAVVGMSNRKDRPSYAVGMYLKENGYQIIPVNPYYNEIEGMLCYPSIDDIPDNIKIDVVDIFRKPQDVLPVVIQAIRRKVKAIWMQEGVVNKDAENQAKNNGIDVVMDRCILKEHKLRNYKP